MTQRPNDEPVSVEDTTASQYGNWVHSIRCAHLREVETALANIRGKHSNDFLRRITAELRTQVNDSNATKGVSFAPINSDLTELLGVLEGPVDTPYAGGIFWLHIHLLSNWPAKPPVCRFLTPVYHLNIAASGEIHVDILRDQWCPALTIEKILYSLASLLDEPWPSKHPDTAQAVLFAEDRAAYDENAKLYTLLDAQETTYELTDEDKIEMGELQQAASKTGQF